MLVPQKKFFPIENLREKKIFLFRRVHAKFLPKRGGVEKISIASKFSERLTALIS